MQTTTLRPEEARELAGKAKQSIETRQAERDLESARAARQQSLDREKEAQEVFRTTISDEIRDAAECGNYEVKIFWRHCRPELLRHIEQVAKSNGYTTNFHSEQVDHGDFAAPCVVTETSLTISWKERR